MSGFVDIREEFHPCVYLRSPDGRITKAEWPDPRLLALPRECAICMIVDWREAVPWSQKLSPRWLLANDWDETPPPWYLPNRPMWYREVMWFGRNPAENVSHPR